MDSIDSLHYNLWYKYKISNTDCNNLSIVDILKLKKEIYPMFKYKDPDSMYQDYQSKYPKILFIVKIKF